MNTLLALGLIGLMWLMDLTRGDETQTCAGAINFHWVVVDILSEETKCGQSDSKIVAPNHIFELLNWL